jgi:hypothetical protein
MGALLDAWLHEIELDGYRIAARIERGKGSDAGPARQ